MSEELARGLRLSIDVGAPGPANVVTLECELSSTMNLNTDSVSVRCKSDAGKERFAIVGTNEDISFDGNVNTGDPATDKMIADQQAQTMCLFEWGTLSGKKYTGVGPVNLSFSAPADDVSKFSGTINVSGGLTPVTVP